MKDEKPKLKKQIEEPTRDSGNLEEAIEWVYKRYGTDLPAVFRDAYKEAERKHRESERGTEAYRCDSSQS